MKVILNLLLGMLFAASLQAKTIYFVPYPKSNPLKTFYDPHSSLDEVAKKWCALRIALEQKGYTVAFTQDAKDLKDVEAIISITNTKPELLKNLTNYPKNKCILLAYEPPVYMPKIHDKSLTDYFGKILVMFDDIVDNVNYFKLYYAQPRFEMVKNILRFDEKKLCVFIGRNKKSSHPSELYNERINTINYFTQHHPAEFDLYGSDWEGYQNWKGTVVGKWKIYTKYKFNICYENMKDQVGYITEKIFDSFVGGCVPVYWGADNIGDYIPSECYIDRRQFATNEDLHHFLISMDEKTYNNYLSAIKNFLASPQAEPFTIDYFIKTIFDLIN